MWRGPTNQYIYITSYKNRWSHRAAVAIYDGIALTHNGALLALLRPPPPVTLPSSSSASWALRPPGSSMRLRIRQVSVGLGSPCSRLDQNDPAGLSLLPAGYATAVSHPDGWADVPQSNPINIYIYVCIYESKQRNSIAEETKKLYSLGLVISR